MEKGDAIYRWGSLKILSKDYINEHNLNTVLIIKWYLSAHDSRKYYLIIILMIFILF